MTSNPVRWFEIYVQDMDRARRFYETVFAAKLQRLNSPDIEMWAFPQAMGQPGCSGALVRMPAFRPAALHDDLLRLRGLRSRGVARRRRGGQFTARRCPSGSRIHRLRWIRGKGVHRSRRRVSQRSFR